MKHRDHTQVVLDSKSRLEVVTRLAITELKHIELTPQGALLNPWCVYMGGCYPLVTIPVIIIYCSKPVIHQAQST